jgi:hypothetical protein
MYRRFSEFAPHCQLTAASSTQVVPTVEKATSFSWHVESLDARRWKTVCIRENHEIIRPRSRNNYVTIKRAPPALHRIPPWELQQRSRKMTDNNVILEIETSVMVLAALYALALVSLIAWLA